MHYLWFLKAFSRQEELQIPIFTHLSHDVETLSCGKQFDELHNVGMIEFLHDLNLLYYYVFHGIPNLSVSGGTDPSQIWLNLGV